MKQDYITSGQMDAELAHADQAQPDDCLPDTLEELLRLINSEATALKATGSATTKPYAERLKDLSEKAYGIVSQPKLAATPAAEWRVTGEADPHDSRYDCERAALCMGKLTDDELANGAFMNYDVRPPIADIVAGKAFSPIAWMSAVKDRIRWLSRRLVESEQREKSVYEILDQAVRYGKNKEDAIAEAYEVFNKYNPGATKHG